MPIALLFAEKVAYSVLFNTFRIHFLTSLLRTVIYSGVYILLVFTYFNCKKKKIHPVDTILHRNAVQYSATLCSVLMCLLIPQTSSKDYLQLSQLYF